MQQRGKYTDECASKHLQRLLFKVIRLQMPACCYNSPETIDLNGEVKERKNALYLFIWMF
jgi:hypothetical protein